jgi:RNA polymerase sigma factor (sigma-70 family)
LGISSNTVHTRYFNTLYLALMNQEHLAAFDDRELLVRLQQNDELVFTLLYQKYWLVLTRLATPFVEDIDTCHEIVQDLFVTLYRKRTLLKIKISLRAYLYRSLRNKIRNHIRRRRIYNRHLSVAKPSHPDMTNDVEQFVNRIELEREIMACLNQMPVKLRRVYLLYNQERHSLKEIAMLLDRPVDTVEKQFRKAVLLLRNHLSGHAAGD